MEQKYKLEYNIGMMLKIYHVLYNFGSSYIRLLNHYVLYDCCFILFFMCLYFLNFCLFDVYI